MDYFRVVGVKLGVPVLEDAVNRCAIAASICLATLAPSAAYAQTPQPQEPTVTTSGEGIVRAAPDRAFVTVTAESRAQSPREAQRRNAELMKPVQDKLRALGVLPDAIRTTVIDLHQEFDYPNGRRVSKGYLAVNSIEVRVDALDRLGELLDTVVATGATSVSDVRFDVKERAKYEREAIRLAVQDARARVDAAAAGVGRTVDKLLRIDEQGVISPPVPIRARVGVAEMQASRAPDTPISAGEMEFRARVALTATLK